ncbi:MAG: hypothetical protein LLG00_06305 [Planctomycetaceae bacterium]|nr:hypothetical protein [Planctomycetaceae bacterium]
MSSKRFTVGSCLTVAALFFLATAPAMAQRGGGARAGGGWSGYHQGMGQGGYSGWQHPGSSYGGRQYGYGYGYDGRPYHGGYYGSDWGRYGYGRGWPRYGWWGGWGPRWGWSGSSYGWPGYYYGYDGDYYGTDYGNYSPMYEEEDEEPYVSGETLQQGGEEGYLSEAIDAFENGDYRTALRMAGHAAVDDPRNPQVHLIATLSLFALGDYRGAASQAHLLAALGKQPTWDDVYGLYGNARSYTRHIRALENYVKSNRSSPDARFLLGFLYLTGGYRDAAKTELQAANKLSPRDRIAVRLLRRVGGTPTTEMARRPESKERETDVDRQRREGGQPVIQPRTGSKPIEGVQPLPEGQKSGVKQQVAPQPPEGAIGPQGEGQQPGREAGNDDAEAGMPRHPKPQNEQ